MHIYGTRVRWAKLVEIDWWSNYERENPLLHQDKIFTLHKTYTINDEDVILPKVDTTFPNACLASLE